MSVFNMSPRSQITSLRGSASAWSRLSIADWSGLAASSAAILFCGFLAGEYAKQVLILFMINLMLVTSYRLITTMGGWSFAHIAFAALGAYTMALLTTSLGLSFWIAIFAGVLVADCRGTVARLSLATYPAIQFLPRDFCCKRRHSAKSHSILQSDWRHERHSFHPPTFIFSWSVV
nr:hypothetical protein [Rhizobium sp. AN83]